MKNYAYVTLLTDNSYSNGVALLQYSLQKTSSIYPLVCLVTEEVSEDIVILLNKIGVTTLLVNTIFYEQLFLHNKKVIGEEQAKIWRNTMTKLNIFRMTGYDKIVFLDADTYINRNIDHLFLYPHMTAAQDVSGFYHNHFLLNSGLLVVEPEKREFDNIINFTNSLLQNDLDRYDTLADQDIINLYFCNWKTQYECQLGDLYNIHAPFLGIEYTECCKIPRNYLIKNSYVFHFIGKNKPWTVDLYQVKELQFIIEEMKQIQTILLKILEEDLND